MSEVHIGTPIQRDADTGMPAVTAHPATFTAVWDTGAPYTLAVPRVILAADLKQRGFRPVGGINGPVQIRPVYPASIVMPVDAQNFVIRFADIAKLMRNNQLGDIDMLIGMDIISTGETKIARRKDGNLWFSFSTE